MHLLKPGPEQRLRPVVQHDLGGAHLAVVVRGGDDRDAGTASGAEHAVEDPALGHG